MNYVHKKRRAPDTHKEHLRETWNEVRLAQADRGRRATEEYKSRNKSAELVRPGQKVSAKARLKIGTRIHFLAS